MANKNKNEIKNRNKIANVPILRFEGFQGEWEETTIANSCIVNPKTKSLSTEFVYIDLESVVKGELLKEIVINKLDAPSRAQRVLDDFDILFQCVRPYQMNNYIYRKRDNRQWVASTGYAQIRTRNNPIFIYHLLNTPKFSKEVMLRCTGTSYPAIASTDLSKIDIAICSHEEQDKIATFLSFIDDRISTQIQIIEDLKVLKNAMSNRLIYYNNSLDKKIKLSDIGNVKNGYAFTSTSYEENGRYKVVTISNVTGERNANTLKCNTITDLPKDIQSHQILKNGDILISLTGNVGRVSLCNTDNALLNQRVGLFVLDNLSYAEYVFQAISNQKFEKTMIASGKGAAQMNISKSDIENYEVPYSSDEKLLLKISSLLKNFDKKINLEIKQYDLLVKQKKYLLSQMFI